MILGSVGLQFLLRSKTMIINNLNLWNYSTFTKKERQNSCVYLIRYVERRSTFDYAEGRQKELLKQNL